MKGKRLGSEPLNSIFIKVRKELETAGIEEPNLDAELILSQAIGVSRALLYLNWEQRLKPSQIKKIQKWTKARAQRKPLAYIIGKTWFREIELEVDPSVLIPRPETELLVEQAIRLIKSESGIKKILDLATGSGAIILSLAYELKELKREFQWFGSDISARALKLAEKNARKSGLSKEIYFRLGELFKPFSKEKFQLIICNPPYIPSDELHKLQPEVSRYEPKIALDGGKGGLKVIIKILSQAGSYLFDRGWLLMEIGQAQAEKLKKISSPGLELKKIVKDYQGIERIAIFQGLTQKKFFRTLSY